MQAILLALSILALLAGAAMIGFGIPVNEFGIGNTLIMAGTTAMVGGGGTSATSLEGNTASGFAFSFGE